MKRGMIPRRSSLFQSGEYVSLPRKRARRTDNSGFVDVSCSHGVEECGCEEDAPLFCIDRVGVNDPSAAVPNGRVSFEAQFKFPLASKIEETELEDAAHLTMPRKDCTCFNCCQTDHMVNQCPFQMNERRIRMNRQKFRQSKQQFASDLPPKSYRYHGLGGVGNTRKFANIRPGEFSEGLRRALKLKNYQLPAFVYRMRAIGYPPGWLKEIQLTCSVHGGGALAPDGQDGIQYDFKRLIRFPGATDPVPDGYRDECDTYRVPAYREHLLNLPEHFVKKGNIVTDNDDPYMASSFLSSRTQSESSTVDVTIDDEETDTSCKQQSIPYGTSISIELSTPILLSAERLAQKVPAMEKFAVGINEYRFFENLPGSTGNYERLMNVLKNNKTNTEQEDKDGNDDDDDNNSESDE